jgi:hypothetical protein
MRRSRPNSFPLLTAHFPQTRVHLAHLTTPWCRQQGLTWQLPKPARYFGVAAGGWVLVVGSSPTFGPLQQKHGDSRVDPTPINPLSSCSTSFRLGYKTESSPRPSVPWAPTPRNFVPPPRAPRHQNREQRKHHRVKGCRRHGASPVVSFGVQGRSRIFTSVYRTDLVLPRAAGVPGCNEIARWSSWTPRVRIAPWTVCSVGIKVFLEFTCLPTFVYS